MLDIPPHTVIDSCLDLRLLYKLWKPPLGNLTLYDATATIHALIRRLGGYEGFHPGDDSSEDVDNSLGDDRESDEPEPDDREPDDRESDEPEPDDRESDDREPDDREPRRHESDDPESDDRERGQVKAADKELFDANKGLKELSGVSNDTGDANLALYQAFKADLAALLSAVCRDLVVDKSESRS
jgi:hypothetical protein